MNYCIFNLCDGSGAIPVRWSEGGDGTTWVEHGRCPCLESMEPMPRPDDSPPVTRREATK